MAEEPEGQQLVREVRRIRWAAWTIVAYLILEQVAQCTLQLRQR